MAVINIDDAYILDETGAEVDKVTGLFTKDENTDAGEKAFAQLNIGTAGSNRNLLDNPWFTVNQRSFTTGSVTAPIDRWRVGGATTATWSENGMSIVTTQTDQGLYQRVPKGVLFAGETYTLTLLTQEGELYSRTIVMPSSGHLSGKLNGGADDLRYYVAVTSNYDEVWMYRHTAGTLNIKAEKVEKGFVSTLANDTPPDYAEELAKCKFYCRVQEFTTDVSVGIGWAFSNSGAVIPNIFGFGNEMRAVPTVTSTGSFVLRTTSGSNINVTSFAIGASVKDAISLNASVASGLTANQPVRLQAGTGAKLVFSADL